MPRTQSVPVTMRRINKQEIMAQIASDANKDKIGKWIRLDNPTRGDGERTAEVSRYINSKTIFVRYCMPDNISEVASEYTAKTGSTPRTIRYFQIWDYNHFLNRNRGERGLFIDCDRALEVMPEGELVMKKVIEDELNRVYNGNRLKQMMLRRNPKKSSHIYPHRKPSRQDREDMREMLKLLASAKSPEDTK